MVPVDPADSDGTAGFSRAGARRFVCPRRLAQEQKRVGQATAGYGALEPFLLPLMADQIIPLHDFSKLNGWFGFVGGADYAQLVERDGQQLEDTLEQLDIGDHALHQKVERIGVGRIVRPSQPSSSQTSK